MATGETEKFHFEGEEAESGYAAPVLDLIAAGFLILMSIAIMIGSVALPVPGDIRTAPGLLPFIVAATLLLMCLGLGYSAWSRMRTDGAGGILDDRDLRTDVRSLLLAIIVAAYIATLDFLAFQLYFPVFGRSMQLSAFEPATIITLALVISLHWRGPLWITALVSVGWTTLLSVVFQTVFRLPLPGSF